MITEAWQLLKDFVSGGAALLRFREKQADRMNTPEMQANARAKQDAEIKDAANAAIKKDDLETLRKLGAE